jgi:hypothetical protein
MPECRAKSNHPTSKREEPPPPLLAWVPCWVKGGIGDVCARPRPIVMPCCFAYGTVMVFEATPSTTTQTRSPWIRS